MPWIKEDDCVGCGICVRKCPVGAINMVNRIAAINDTTCIRCGICHEVCPRDAVRHDSERIPLEVEVNIDWVNELLANFKTSDERTAFFDRMKKHFNKEKIVAEKTIEKIEVMADQGVDFR